MRFDNGDRVQVVGRQWFCTRNFGKCGKVRKYNQSGTAVVDFDDGGYDNGYDSDLKLINVTAELKAPATGRRGIKISPDWKETLEFYALRSINTGKIPDGPITVFIGEKKLKSIIRAALTSERKKERKAVAKWLIKNGSGGGNWRRLCDHLLTGRRI